ncbi:histidinol phosphate phosphatase HisJ family [Syntrophobotulus glycolicus DSM 8271]|uniref:Histidinol-phosphatase n=1 Tax=Syntrophobotulus glycolicus (strain DSM 8271 / FlGlyR) TaxID=645991 RepID=F0SZY3_SYNGF|nr:histidinol-phosphatase [Syntrophobotulus glycolicus]ADY54994.1 histidinol phosphate phosphatase HisJ family [Syntrophobotulus glycolicus DSM 8271]
MLDLHVHLLGHLERTGSQENIRGFLDKAVEAGLSEIGFTDHDDYFDHLDFGLIREVAAEYPHLRVKVGLEADYREGEEGRIKSLLSRFDFDYVIGSVHEIRGWLFDMPQEEQAHYIKEPDRMYKDYFRLLEKAARSGLFQIIGHLDLIKIFGVRPKTDVRELAAGVLDAVQESGLAVEINTNGRYKPVGEWYPEQKLIEEVIRRNIPLALGSDAHVPENVGRDIQEVAALLRKMGVGQIVSFDREKKILINL